MSWELKFPEPITVTDGEPLLTLRDARAYITSLPLEVHDAKAWQTAMECLLLAADKGGPIEFTRLAMEQVTRPKIEPTYRSLKKNSVWRNTRKFARG